MSPHKGKANNSQISTESSIIPSWVPKVFHFAPLLGLGLCLDNEKEGW